MDDDIDQRPTCCCPDEDRLDGRFMSGDCHVVDVHPHKGLLRGLVHNGSAKPRVLFWHKNGQLSPKVKSPFDLERIG